MLEETCGIRQEISLRGSDTCPLTSWDGVIGVLLYGIMEVAPEWVGWVAL